MISNEAAEDKEQNGVFGTLSNYCNWDRYNQSSLLQSQNGSPTSLIFKDIQGWNFLDHQSTVHGKGIHTLYHSTQGLLLIRTVYILYLFCFQGNAFTCCQVQYYATSISDSFVWRLFFYDFYFYRDLSVSPYQPLSVHTNTLQSHFHISTQVHPITNQSFQSTMQLVERRQMSPLPN